MHSHHNRHGPNELVCCGERLELTDSLFMRGDHPA